MSIPSHTSTDRQTRADLDVATPIVDFVDEALDGETIDGETFWQDLSDLFRDLTPRNRELLAERDRLQAALDAYHRANPGQPNPAEYKALLESIGYLLPEPKEVAIGTENVDDEIARVAGPQLVVPLLNARFAINAANARWGSLYDALYGTDAIDQDGDLSPGDTYNPKRGAEVITRARALLDQIAPLTAGSHAAATAYRVEDDALVIETGNGTVSLVDRASFAGFKGQRNRPTGVLLVHHGLHVEIVIDPNGRIGQTDAAGVDDVIVESAITTIMDLEDSVAAVDADDKALGYRNWRGLMDGKLQEEVTKQGSTFTRVLNADREYMAPDGSPLTLPGRSLLLVRNVGHLMTTDAVRDASGDEVPEGILDAVMTALGSLPDLRGASQGQNSRTGSMYIVKPKMHGPAEVAFAVELFGRVEQLLGLPHATLKIGIMDEERRTTVNLRACIAESSERVVFINTGFLDRTGDEIHTSLYAGPIVPKALIKKQPFIAAYEAENVAAGLATGFPGRAQIGKGMWAMPDLMYDMLEQKIAHVRTGATTAWVPSPTAATLHALHYLEVDASSVQSEIASLSRPGVDEVLIPPLLEDELTREQIVEELDNNVQSILGYVVRWIDQGVGCSKVPNIHGVALMEDRATLRISSQLLANWLEHEIVSIDDVNDSLRRLSPVVDEQNANDASYEVLLGPNGPGTAFQSARRLIVEGAAQPSGYTEPILHEMRRRKKGLQQ